MVYLVIVFAVLSRFVPHVWNFSPVYGALLFGGAHLKKRDSVWLPVLLLGASDIVLTKFIYHLNVGWDELFQLAAFASIAMTGWMLRKNLRAARLVFACLAAPILFYLISDFGVWLGFHTYPPTWSGLLACYVAAMPFQGRITASTFLFAGIFFGARQLYAARVQRSVRLVASR
jgi:hypothetical protein